MKKAKKTNRSAKLILIIFLALFVSVGFAILSGNFNINGYAAFHKSELETHLENIQVKEGSVDAISNPVITENGLGVNYDVALNSVGDSFGFSVDTVNTGRVDAMISSVGVEGIPVAAQEAITYSVEYDDGTNVAVNDILKVGERKTINVTTTYANTYADNLDLNLSFNLEYVKSDKESGADKATPGPVMKNLNADVPDGLKEYYPSVKTIDFGYDLTEPVNTLASFDISSENNGSVMAYVVPNESDATKYDLYIEGDKGLSAPSDCTDFLLELYTIETINNINLLDISGVTNTTRMFYKSGVTALNISTWDTSSITDMTEMFAGTNLTDYSVLKNWDVSKVTSFKSMFYNASISDLTVLEKWNTSSVKDISAMFMNTQITSVSGLESWDTSSITTISSLFNECINLKTADLSSWNLSNINKYNSIFYNCTNLEEVNISNFDTSSATYVNGLFSGCSSLSKIDMSSASFDNIITNSDPNFTGYVDMLKNVKNGIEIIVKDSAAKTFIEDRLADDGISGTVTIKTV